MAQNQILSPPSAGLDGFVHTASLADIDKFRKRMYILYKENSNSLYKELR